MNWAGNLRTLLCAVITAAVLVSCTQEGHQPDLSHQDIRLTILHTTDWHGRLLPYDMDVLLTDERLGLNPELGPFGGIARLAYLIDRERANAGRSIYVDSGDCFQGAPIFNVFEGEVEFRAMSMLRPDGVVLGNHEFDNGLLNLTHKAANFADFPLLAANYHFRTPADPNQLNLGDFVRPYSIVNVDGLKIGIIGIANFSSLSSIGFADNGTGVQPIDIIQSVQHYINLLHPQVNLIIGVSHAGLDEDHEIIENTVGLDMIMGGHLHIVLSPPRIVHDAAGREVVLAHSGAFLKYLGRMDAVVRAREDDPNDFEVISHDYEVFPIDRTVPEDPEMLRMLEPYVRELRQEIDLTRILAYAPRRIRRFGANGGDSPLGNFVSDSMRARQRVQTDFAVTNSLGVRSDVVQGPVILDQTYNVFPFPNTITTMTLSANEVQQLLNFNAQRSAGRGCATQLQAAGISFVNDCSVYPAEARDIKIQGVPIQDNRFYTMATNNYMAQGGSGFRVLRFNNTQQDTGISIRDAVNDAMQAMPSCFDRCQAAGEDLDGCALLATCVGDITQLFTGFCNGYDPFSPAEYCLELHAPRCLEESDLSDWAVCRQFADPVCNELFYSADREACFDVTQGECAGENQVSPRAACAQDTGAEFCMDEDTVSEFDSCVLLAVQDAEDTCVTLPCLDAESDGRITRILPSNDFVPTDDESVAGQDAAALMSEIQASEHNHEACY